MRLLSKRNSIILGLGLTIVAVVSGYFIFAALHTKPIGSNNSTPPVSTKDEPVYSDIKKEKAKLETAKSDKEKAAAYTELSNLYANTKSEKSVSVTYAQKLTDLAGDSESYAQLGFAYMQAGDNQKAADAYQKAADLAPNKVDDGRSDYSYYLQQAQALRSE